MDDLERFNAFGKKGYNNDTPKIFSSKETPYFGAKKITLCVGIKRSSNYF